MIKKFNELNEARMSQKTKLKYFLDELSDPSKKYGYYLDTTDTLFLTNDDDGSLDGELQYDSNLEKYILIK